MIAKVCLPVTEPADRFSFLLPEGNEEPMKDLEVVKKSSEEAAPEQAQLPHEKKEEERQFWLDTKYPDESGDSDR